MKKTIITMIVFMVFFTVSSTGGGSINGVKEKRQLKQKAFMTGNVIYQ